MFRVFFGHFGFGKSGFVFCEAVSTRMLVIWILSTFTGMHSALAQAEEKTDTVRSLSLLQASEFDTHTPHELLDEELSDFTLFEYGEQHSLVVADHEWQYLDAAAYQRREAFVKRFFARKMLNANLSGDSQIDFSAELEMIAAYYAKHDYAFNLVERLSNTTIKLKYVPNTFRTEVTGNALQITGVKVLFDTYASAEFTSGRRSDDAAVLRISAADALLHELLHAEMALKNGKAFIASGALFGVGYPVEHEREIIARERELFAAMSSQDGVPRPQRHSHAGHLTESDCSVCF